MIFEAYSVISNSRKSDLPHSNASYELKYNLGIKWYRIINPGAEKSNPDIENSNLFLGHDIQDCLRVIYSRVYINNTIHNELYCRCFNSKLGNVSNTIESPGEIVLFFGKHNGKKIKDIPEEYLKWCLGNIETDKVVKSIKAYLADKRSSP